MEGSGRGHDRWSQPCIHRREAHARSTIMLEVACMKGL